MSVAGTADYEHWPDDGDDDTVISAPSVVSGYNTANGLREYNYKPANEDKDKDAPKEKKRVEVTTKSSEPTQPQPAQYAYQFPPPPQFQPQYMPGYTPMMQYTCYPTPHQQYPMAVPAPAYYGLPPPPQAGMTYGIPQGYIYSPAPATAAPSRNGSTDWKKDQKEKATKDNEKDEKKDGTQDEKDKKSKKADRLKWQGRTEAEVEEDNMKVAAKEGAYDARKVVPVGLQDDQIVWIILPDGTQSVRTWAEAKSMPGEWLEDPRFKHGWFLLCPQEKKGNKGSDKVEKNGSKKDKKQTGKGDRKITEKDNKGDKKGNKGKNAGEDGKEEQQAEDEGTDKEEKKSCSCGGK